MRTLNELVDSFKTFKLKAVFLLHVHKNFNLNPFVMLYDYLAFLNRLVVYVFMFVTLGEVIQDVQRVLFRIFLLLGL